MQFLIAVLFILFLASVFVTVVSIGLLLFPYMVMATLGILVIWFGIKFVLNIVFLVTKT